MELKQIEYDYENAHISYALQRLNTEKTSPINSIVFIWRKVSWLLPAKNW